MDRRSRDDLKALWHRPLDSGRRFAQRVAALCTIALLAGCASVTVSSMSPIEYLAQRRGDVLTTRELGLSSQAALNVIGYPADACLSQAAACIDALSASFGLEDEQRLSAMSEIWLHRALVEEREPSGAEHAALDAWLETARHAYAYLFFTARSPGQRAFEDRQTQVRDYYNFAVQRAVGLMFQAYRQTARDALKPARVPPRSTWYGQWRIQSDVSQLNLPQGLLPEELVAASSLRFSGLRNTYRRDGFGAELVTVMPPAALPPQAPAASPTAFRETRFPPATALVHFSGDTATQVLETRDIRVVIHDPYLSREVRIGQQSVPLAADFTAGYGLWLARSGFAVEALRTLFGRDGGIDRPRVHLMQPYDPSRRIVVMLHGLASSPEAWVNVANEVLGDERLRERYQIWQIYYPTNLPLALNQRAIRQALAETLAHFDPQGTANASKNMVLVGHSMGGVLARLLVSRSGDELLRAVTPGFDALIEGRGEAAREALVQLRPYLHFDPMPQVSAAIFIAAPHRGTAFANNRIARRIANLITLPLTLAQQLGEISLSLAKLQAPLAGAGSSMSFRIPNSVDQLSDRDTFIRAAARLPISPRVRYHSIIGNDQPELSLDETTDGVVPYASAHLSGAASELVIPSTHSVQEHPAAIVEIRRILRAELQTAPR